MSCTCGTVDRRNRFGIYDHFATLYTNRQPVTPSTAPPQDNQYHRTARKIACQFEVMGRADDPAALRLDNNTARITFPAGSPAKNLRDGDYVVDATPGDTRGQIYVVTSEVKIDIVGRRMGTGDITLLLRHVDASGFPTITP